ncbi:uncharacterized protein BDR25DRAFT_300652 [Lindgomyces ingoldianus]|uniref:Uncharacterized protein n=1 Tax=Lindgomyces ingoldianus TaxID=673940 RepID=A0ACB6R8I0_9PLEO|nr:uncharacterized protein BDR25DRAFT_300652 [Lindgomyces ingoldianus]KAF2475624.1 hypothetical protein BDR25DRAFT_300652 [Lindgomyces ingoldianus]
MHSLALASFTLLLTLIHASPIIPRDAIEVCSPTQYTIKGYTYTFSKDPDNIARLSFNFQSLFPGGSTINDPALNTVACDISSPTGVIPNEVECSSGRKNFYFDLRGPQENADFQFIHTWQCNGHEWMSSTHHKIDPLSCTTSVDGLTTMCNGGPDVFQAESVREICGTPTHC